MVSIETRDMYGSIHDGVAVVLTGTGPRVNARESVIDADSVTAVAGSSSIGSALMISVTVMTVGAALSASSGMVSYAIGFVDSPRETVALLVPFGNCRPSRPPRRKSINHRYMRLEGGREANRVPTPPIGNIKWQKQSHSPLSLFG